METDTRDAGELGAAGGAQAKPAGEGGAPGLMASMGKAPIPIISAEDSVSLSGQDRAAGRWQERLAGIKVNPSDPKSE
jgi:predicted secreted protein